MKYKKKAILIIDANKKRSLNLSSRLRLKGYPLESYSSGMQALKCLESSSPSQTYYTLVILSGDSKEMPAREILSLIRNIASKKDLPILFLFSESQKERDEDELQAIQEESNSWAVHTDPFQDILAKIDALMASQ